MALLPSPGHVLLVAVLSSLLHFPAAAPTSSESGLSSTAVTSRDSGNVDIVTEHVDLLSDHASEDNFTLKKEESDFETQNEDLKIDEEVEKSDSTESSLEDHTSLSEDDVVDVNILSDSTGTRNNQANREAINETQELLYNDDDMKTSTLFQEDNRRNKTLLNEESDFETQNVDLTIDEEVEKSASTESSVEDHTSLSEDDVVDVNRLSDSTGTRNNQANREAINETHDDMKTSKSFQEDSRRNKPILYDIGRQLFEDKDSFVTTDSTKSLPQLDVVDNSVFSFTEESAIPSDDKGGRLVELDPPQDKKSNENDSTTSFENVVGDAIATVGAGSERALGIGPLEENDKDGTANTEDILTSNIGPTNWQIFAFVLSIALLVASGIMIYFIATISRETDSDDADLVVPLSQIPYKYIKVETAEVLSLDKVQ